MVNIFKESENYIDSYMHLLIKSSITDSKVLTEEFSGSNVAMNLEAFLQTVFQKIKEFIQKLIQGAKNFFYKLKQNKKNFAYKHRINTLINQLYKAPKSGKVSFPDIDSYLMHLKEYFTELNKVKKDIVKMSVTDWGISKGPSDPIDKLGTIRAKYHDILLGDLNREVDTSLVKVVNFIKDNFNGNIDKEVYENLPSLWNELYDYSEKMSNGLYENKTNDFKDKAYETIEKTKFDSDLVIERLNKLKYELVTQFNDLRDMCTAVDQFCNQMIDNFANSMRTRPNMSERELNKVGKKYDKGKLDDGSNLLIDIYNTNQAVNMANYIDNITRSTQRVQNDMDTMQLLNM